MLGLFSKKKADPKEELRTILGDVELPTFPAIVTTVLERIRDENVSFNEISDLLAGDPGLTVKLLGTVNSAAFALRQTVKSIHHAVSLIGRNQLESMLISVAARRAIPESSARGFVAQRFWSTSARRAVAGRSLAELIDPSSASETFTASLLQDLAIPFLSLHKGEPYADVLEEWHHSEKDLVQIERGAFEWDHATVAGWFCVEWGLPDRISESIAMHHGVEPPVPCPLPAVALVAHLREVDQEPGFERLIETAHDRFQIPKDASADLLRESAAGAEDLARLFA